VAAAKPVSATVVGEFAPRGGIYSKMTASYSASSSRGRSRTPRDRKRARRG